MSAPRKLKKSESLEIRIPFPTKQAFMARCQDRGVSASEALRGFIESELAPARPAARRRAPWRWLIAGLLAAGMGAAAVPSLARPGLTAAEFAALDANHDGVLTLAEFQRR